MSLVFRLMIPAICLVGCAAHSKPIKQSGSTAAVCQQGVASWYGAGFKKTASGERYDPSSLTAAHRTLPFGTLVRVTSVRTKRSVVVRINNRGPYTRGRIIDVSKAAATQLRMIGSGIARVELEILNPPAIAEARAPGRF